MTVLEELEGGSFVSLSSSLVFEDVTTSDAFPILSLPDGYDIYIKVYLV